MPRGACPNQRSLSSSAPLISPLEGAEQKGAVLEVPSIVVDLIEPDRLAAQRFGDEDRPAFPFDLAIASDLAYIGMVGVVGRSWHPIPDPW